MVENQTKKRIKFFQIVNGGEFLLIKNFNNFMKQMESFGNLQYPTFQSRMGWQNGKIYL